MRLAQVVQPLIGCKDINILNTYSHAIGYSNCVANNTVGAIVNGDTYESKLGRLDQLGQAWQAGCS